MYQGGKKTLLQERERTIKNGRNAGEVVTELVCRFVDGNDVYFLTFNPQQYTTDKSGKLSGSTGNFHYGYVKKYKKSNQQKRTFGYQSKYRKSW